MPTTTIFGTKGPVNQAIGGVPVIHNFDFQSRGRGHVVRLFLIDTGAAFVDIRYDLGEWPKYLSNGEAIEMNPVCSMPIVEMPHGRILTQSYAIIRHWARGVGAYDGESEAEKYWVDAICNIAIDWRTLFIKALFSGTPQTDYPKHKEGDRRKYLDALNTQLEISRFSRLGAFVLGENITYADLVLYQLLQDENLVQPNRDELKSHKYLLDLVEAVEKRPNINMFLKSSGILSG